ncbi:MAG: pyruvate kinase [bacterium]|nr:pyruvate kinase [bacterium]
MPQDYNRKTKIIATIGPASEKPDILEVLIKEGVDAARLNLSHDSHENHQRRIDLIRKFSKKYDRYVAIICDLQGPKIRIGSLPADGVELVAGKKVVINASVSKYEKKEIPLPSDIFAKGVKKGARVLLDDGMMEMKVLSVKGPRFNCVVYRGGKLLSNKGVNVPTLELRKSILEEKDRTDIDFAKKAGADYIALSFLRTAKDVLDAKKLIKDTGIKLIAKIERPEAVHNLQEIIKAADGIMVARGDLGIETPIWALPVKQKEIIDITRNYTKPVIVATHMLDSMTRKSLPTRAEVSDVANAVYDGADAVMLSSESASGSYPIESVKMMRSILEETEKSLEYFKIKKMDKELPITMSVARSARYIAYDVGAKFIFAGTASGYSARAVSNFRPKQQIIGLTSNDVIARQLNIVWGVTPRVIRAKTVANLAPIAATKLFKKNKIKRGDRIVFISGLKLGEIGQTNNISVISF